MKRIYWNWIDPITADKKNEKEISQSTDSNYTNIPEDDYVWPSFECHLHPIMHHVQQTYDDDMWPI